MSQGISLMFMVSMKKFRGNMEIMQFGTILLMLSNIFLWLLLFRDKFFVFMEDYHPKERLLILLEP